LSLGRPSERNEQPLFNASNAGGGAFSEGSVDRSSGLDTGNVFGNQFGARANRGLSDFDRTHRLIFNLCLGPAEILVGDKLAGGPASAFQLATIWDCDFNVGSAD